MLFRKNFLHAGWHPELVRLPVSEIGIQLDLLAKLDSLVRRRHVEPELQRTDPVRILRTRGNKHIYTHPLTDNVKIRCRYVATLDGFPPSRSDETRISLTLAISVQSKRRVLRMPVSGDLEATHREFCERLFQQIQTVICTVGIRPDYRHDITRFREFRRKRDRDVSRTVVYHVHGINRSRKIRGVINFDPVKRTQIVRGKAQRIAPARKSGLDFKTVGIQAGL